MSIVAFIESNTTGTGRLHMQAARSQGFDVVLFCAKPERYPFVRTDCVSTIVTNTADFVTLRHAVQNMPGASSLRGILSTSEYFAGPAARLGRDFGFPGADPDAIDDCRDKYAQRLHLQEAGLVTPHFWRLTSERELPDVLSAVCLPCVVKPTSGTGSVGVKLCTTPEEVGAHVRVLLAVDRNERGMPIAPAALVEEYIDGPEFSAEMFSGQLLGITRKHLSPHPFFVETGHDFPAPLPSNIIECVQQNMHAALDTLGLAWGHCHVEFRLVNGLPVIVEVNPRLAGGNIPKLVYLASGIDPIDLAIRAHTGQDADLRRARREAASIRFFSFPREGTFLNLDGISTAEACSGVTEVQVYTEGPLVVRINHDFRDRIGHVIATGADADVSARNADEAARNVRVVMDSTSTTGRIKTPLHPTVRAMLFDHSFAQQVEHDLPVIVEVDRAHVVMLAERGVVARRKASLLLSAIEELKRVKFEPLYSRSAPRGLFLAYESYLIDQLGTETGGILQTGRSRNDLSATVFRLKLRRPWASIVKTVAALVAALLRQAWRYRDAVMPIYTHGQAGVPGTFGHYLAGVACGIERDLRFILESSEDIRRCPLGAGAAGGSTMPLDTNRTASLLGFEYAVDHSIDAVASRDLALRWLASLSIFGVTLSRLASDILQWTTTEFGFLEIPDELAGSSSAMPQKKNPFLAEHAIGMSAAPLGAFIQAAAAMRNAPYTNAVQVGTEAIRPLPEALGSIENAAVLMRLMIDGVRPNREAMAARAASGFTTALEWANELVHRQGYDFRSAHSQVGQWIGRLQAGERLESLPPNAVDVVRRAAYGGGPAHATLEDLIHQLRHKCASALIRAREQQQFWRAAQRQLDSAVRECISAGGEQEPEPSNPM
jgi:argininosuccinate lyase